MAIRVLSPEVVAGISAGEVIERPASVVKELVENALDAGASRVRVELESGGMALIRVEDDGCGIPSGEAGLAVSRHATSKLGRLDDLFRLSTYGFRGEALFAIASAGDLEMRTRTAGASSGVVVTVSGDGKASVAPGACNEGTTVSVRDLFRRMPARLKFMKAPKAETAAVLRVLEPYLLIRPEVHFIFASDGVEKLNAPPGRDGVERARTVMGDPAANSVPFSGSGGGAKVRGLAEAPGRVHGRGRQWFVVNGRPIEDKGLKFAMLGAYAGQIPRDAWPWAVVFVDVPPDRLDVNVHPAKSEVKFADARLVHDLLVSAMRDAFRNALGVRSASSPSMAPAGGTAEPYDASRGSGVQAAETPSLWAGGAPVQAPAIEVLGQFHSTYIVARLNGSLVLADQHASHEKIIYERLTSRGGNAPTQALLIPLTVELSPAEAESVGEYEPVLRALGYDFDGLGGRTIALRGVPAGAGDAGDSTAVLHAVLADATSPTGPAGEPLRRMAASLACHSAVKAGDPLDTREMEALLRELLSLKDPGSCPHGRPTMVTIDEPSLARMFKRA